jgi:serine/threonine protein kinase
LNLLPGELWTKVEALFMEAAELPASDREAFVREKSAGDNMIREEVLALLAYCDGEPLDLLAALSADAASVMNEEPAVGQTLGPYRIERELGRGGMAVVYLAVRVDGEFQKHVAIKLIKRGMDTAAVIERLRRERRILAQLDHPNIGRLLDGGTTPEGLPYILMEYVDGLPIDIFCTEHKLGIVERCLLMRQVFEAVSYAHRKLVVHRDLKPTNILVTADGSPKLLDFGLAKILGAESDGSVTVAEHASPLTPNYASPEQLRGAALSTATDIYSLGLIFHELLTGQLPHLRLASDRKDWEKAVCETEIGRPSLLVADERRRKQMQGDLDTILMKAMRKEPDRRYASVDELARDVRRYLEFRPILARPDSFWYRSQKFLRRRRYPLLAAAAAVLSLVLGLVIAVTQARKAEIARRRAEDQLTQMVGLSNRSLSDVHALMERLPGATAARRELIQISLDFLEGVSKDESTNPSLRIAMAKAYLRLGDLLGDPDADSLGDEKGALKSYKTATALLDRVPAGMGGRERLLDWLDLQKKTASLMGTTPAATTLLQQVLAVTLKWRPDELADKDIARSQAGLYLRLARAYTGDYQRADTYATQYRAKIEALLHKYPDDPELQYDLSVAETAKGWALRSLGDPESSAIYYLRTVQLREILVQKHPADLLYQRALMLAYEHYGDLLGGALQTNLGRIAEAREYYKKAQPFAEARSGDPKNTAGSASFAGFLMRESRVDVSGEQQLESLKNLRRAEGIFETLAASGGGPIVDRGLARAHVQLGRCLNGLGRSQEAIAEFERGLAAVERVLTANPKHPDGMQIRMDAQDGFTHAYVLLGNREAALKHTALLMAAANSIGTHEVDEGIPVSRVAQAYLASAKVHGRFREWAEAKEDAESAAHLVRPLAKGKDWDPNAKILREAEGLLSQGEARAALAR